MINRCLSARAVKTFLDSLSPLVPPEYNSIFFFPQFGYSNRRTKIPPISTSEAGLRQTSVLSVPGKALHMAGNTEITRQKMRGKMCPSGLISPRPSGGKNTAGGYKPKKRDMGRRMEVRRGQIISETRGETPEY